MKGKKDASARVDRIPKVHAFNLLLVVKFLC